MVVAGSELKILKVFFVTAEESNRPIQLCIILFTYSEVPNRREDRNKRADLEKSATLLAYLPSKLINEQSGIFRLLHAKLRAGWNKNLKNLSEHALLLGTSEYVLFSLYFTV